LIYWILVLGSYLYFDAWCLLFLPLKAAVREVGSEIALNPDLMVKLINGWRAGGAAKVK
jgi:hypothetical protein